MRTRYYTNVHFHDEPKMETLMLEAPRIDDVRVGDNIAITTGALARVCGIKFDPTIEEKVVFCDAVLVEPNTDAKRHSVVGQALSKGWKNNIFS